MDIYELQTGVHVGHEESSDSSDLSMETTSSGKKSFSSCDDGLKTTDEEESMPRTTCIYNVKKTETESFAFVYSNGLKPYLCNKNSIGCVNLPDDIQLDDDLDVLSSRKCYSQNCNRDLMFPSLENTRAILVCSNNQINSDMLTYGFQEASDNTCRYSQEIETFDHLIARVLPQVNMNARNYLNNRLCDTRAGDAGMPLQSFCQSPTGSFCNGYREICVDVEVIRYPADDSVYPQPVASNGSEDVCVLAPPARDEADECASSAHQNFTEAACMTHKHAQTCLNRTGIEPMASALARYRFDSGTCGHVYSEDDYTIPEIPPCSQRVLQNRTMTNGSFQTTSSNIQWNVKDMLSAHTCPPTDSVPVPTHSEESKFPDLINPHLNTSLSDEDTDEIRDNNNQDEYIIKGACTTVSSLAKGESAYDITEITSSVTQLDNQANISTMPHIVATATRKTAFCENMQEMREALLGTSGDVTQSSGSGHTVSSDVDHSSNYDPHDVLPCSLSMVACNTVKHPTECNKRDILGDTSTADRTLCSVFEDLSLSQSSRNDPSYSRYYIEPHTTASVTSNSGDVWDPDEDICESSESSLWSSNDDTEYEDDDEYNSRGKRRASRSNSRDEDAKSPRKETEWKGRDKDMSGKDMTCGPPFHSDSGQESPRSHNVECFHGGKVSQNTASVKTRTLGMKSPISVHKSPSHIDEPYPVLMGEPSHSASVNVHGISSDLHSTKKFPSYQARAPASTAMNREAVDENDPIESEEYALGFVSLLEESNEEIHYRCSLSESDHSSLTDSNSLSENSDMLNPLTDTPTANPPNWSPACSGSPGDVFTVQFPTIYTTESGNDISSANMDEMTAVCLPVPASGSRQRTSAGVQYSPCYPEGAAPDSLSLMVGPSYPQGKGESDTMPNNWPGDNPGTGYQTDDSSFNQSLFSSLSQCLMPDHLAELTVYPGGVSSEISNTNQGIFLTHATTEPRSQDVTGMHTVYTSGTHNAEITTPAVNPSYHRHDQHAGTTAKASMGADHNNSYQARDTMAMAPICYKPAGTHGYHPGMLSIPAKGSNTAIVSQTITTAGIQPGILSNPCNVAGLNVTGPVMSSSTTNVTRCPQSSPGTAGIPQRQGLPCSSAGDSVASTYTGTPCDITAPLTDSQNALLVHENIGSRQIYDLWMTNSSKLEDNYSFAGSNQEAGGDSISTVSPGNRSGCNMNTQYTTYELEMSSKSDTDILSCGSSTQSSITCTGCQPLSTLDPQFLTTDAGKTTVCSEGATEYHIPPQVVTSEISMALSATPSAPVVGVSGLGSYGYPYVSTDSSHSQSVRLSIAAGSLYTSNPGTQSNVLVDVGTVSQCGTDTGVESSMPNIVYTTSDLRMGDPRLGAGTLRYTEEGSQLIVANEYSRLNAGISTVSDTATLQMVNQSLASSHHYMPNPTVQPDGPVNNIAVLGTSTATRQSPVHGDNRESPQLPSSRSMDSPGHSSIVTQRTQRRPVSESRRRSGLSTPSPMTSSEQSSSSAASLADGGEDSWNGTRQPVAGPSILPRIHERLTVLQTVGVDLEITREEVADLVVPPVDEVDQEGNTHLMTYARDGDAERLLKFILTCQEQGRLEAHILAQDRHGNTPLQIAVAGNHVACAALLLHFGEMLRDVLPAFVEDAATCLHMCVRRGDDWVSMVRVLLAWPLLDVDCRNARGLSALHSTVAQHGRPMKCTDTILVLVQAGADINSRNTQCDRGYTAFHEILQTGDSNLIKAVLNSLESEAARKEALSTEDNNGNSALHILAVTYFQSTKELMDLLEFFVKCGAKVRARNHNKQDVISKIPSTHKAAREMMKKIKDATPRERAKSKKKRSTSL